MLRLSLIFAFYLLFPPQMSGQEISYSGSLQYASGEYYFSETTRSLYLTNGIMLKQGRFNLSLYVPFVMQNTPWVSYSRSGNLPTGGPQHSSVGRGGSDGDGMGSGRHNRRISIPDTASYQSSSFSDPTVSAKVNLLPPATKTSFYIQGDLKFPLSDPHDGYGTGEWDAGLGASVGHRLDRWFVMANITYWWMGDMPDLELKDTISYGGGLGRSLGGDWSILASISGFTEIIEGIDPPVNIGSGISYNINQRSSLFANISFGLTESASDVSLGMGWTFQLN